MKSLSSILFFLVLLPSHSIMAQTSSENYVKTETMLNASESTPMRTVQYFDGIGQPTVSVSTSGSNGETAYSLSTYDALGREESTYLPVVTDYSVSYKSPSTVASNSVSFYQNDATAYTMTHYDALNRITSVEQPGAAWRQADKRQRLVYGTNSSGEVLHYEAHVNQNSLIKPENSSYTYYPAGTLTKETRYDADNKKVETFRDLYGNVVLQRVDNTLCTYYVYDEIGRLRYVLSPEYQKHGTKAIFGYEYRYDNRGRIVKKILPGAEYIQYWYDNADRVICTQDGMMRRFGNHCYRVTVYDRLGRLAIQVRCTSYLPVANRVITATYSSNTSGFLGTGYVLPSDFTIDLGNPQLEVVNYYDSHDFLNRNPYSCFSGMSVTPSVSQAGQLTGSITVATNGEYLSQVMVYDLRGNLVTKKSRELGGHVVTHQCSYSYTNQVESSSYAVDAGYGSSLTLSESVGHNTYTDKVSSYSLSVAHGGPAASTTMTYTHDLLGRLSGVSRPFSGNVSGDISYGYDMHGWPTGITTNSFREELFYAGGLGTPCYNGNISCMKWSNDSYSQKRGYKFTYDNANRMSRAAYGECESLDNRTGRYDEMLEYNDNGNITHVWRWGKKQNGKYGKIDNLNIHYHGNQLSDVEEDALELQYTGSFDYKGSRGSQYGYNENGSLLFDKSRNIAYITYDVSNNPKQIYYTNGNVTRYVYTPSGQKLRVVHYTAVPNVSHPVGTKPLELPQSLILYVDSTDYLLDGRLMMKNGRIDKVLFDGGYCRATPAGTTSDSLSFYYYNRDHLGNVREVVDASGTVQQVTNYYPFGTPYCDDVSVLNSDLQPFKYNGKELDTMHGLNTYDYGARQHDPILCRWDRIDPLCEKYYGISPYAYCANNPVRFIDEHGDSIFVSYDSQEEVLNMINKLSAGTFGISDNGYLYLISKAKQEDNNGKLSSFYRDMLIEGINASNTAYVSIAKERVRFMDKEIDLKNHGEGATVSFENGKAYTYVSGLEYVKEDFSSSSEMVLAHELAGHAIPTIVHPSNLDSRYDGYAVTAENIIRSETGFGLRPIDEYARTDWAVLDMTTSVSKAYIRQMFPKRTF